MLRALVLSAALMIVAIAIVGIAAWRGLHPARTLAPPQRGLTLENVTLVEPGGRRLTHQTLRVTHTKIDAIEPAERDGPYSGAVVLPGLTDMHVHLPAFGLPGDDERTAFLLLAHGVTTARIPGDREADTSNALRERIRAGDIPGPTLFSCGPFIDGASPLWPNSRSVQDPTDAKRVVDAIADSGADCIKVYDGLDAASIAAVREAAHSRKLPVIGHIPIGVSLEVARIDDVQHLRGAHPPLVNERRRHPFFLEAWLRSDTNWNDHVLSVSLEHSIAHTPTLVTLDALLRSEDVPSILDEPDIALLPPVYARTFWHPRSGLNAARSLLPHEFAKLRTAAHEMRRTVAHLHAGGVSIHTGTDTGAPMVVPGASLHRELRLLGEVIGAEASLEASTRVSPRFLGIENAGLLRAGAPANLSIFKDDPTLNLAALDTLVAVVHEGRLYDREMLDRQLNALTSQHASWLNETALPEFAQGFVDALVTQLQDTRD